MLHLFRRIGYDNNLQLYKTPNAVSFYDSLTDLSECERFLFATYLKPGMRILDIGVGGGRTVPYLSAISDNYVGIDYSEEMIWICRKKFPDLRFFVVDASDMSRFPAESFDAVVFSFNGIDHLYPDQKRSNCFQEVFRILKNQGLFIFSAHNARGVLTIPVPEGGPIWMKVGRVLFSLIESIRSILDMLLSLAFFREASYVLDSRSFWSTIHVSTSKNVLAELNHFRFRALRILGSNYPRLTSRYATHWYYYVFAKDEKVI